MTQRFTTNQNKPNTNLMHDLHSVEAKIDMSNTEGIMYVVAYPDIVEAGDKRIYTMRNGLPYWAKGAAITRRKIRNSHRPCFRRQKHGN